MVFVTDTKSWEVKGLRGGARPQTVEIMKTFDQRCPQVRITNKEDKANYVITLEHEGGKELGQKDNKVVVFNSNGIMIHSNSTAVLGHAVQGACSAILSDWGLRARAASDQPNTQSTEKESQPILTKAEPQPAAPPNRVRPAGVYVDMYETDSHKKRSKPEIAYAVTDDVVAYLKSKNVMLATDRASAAYRLQLTVDRPLMKWIRVTVQLFDGLDRQLWEKVAESGGGVTGGHGLEVTIKRLHELLNSKISDLPVLPAEAQIQAPK